MCNSECISFGKRVLTPQLLSTKKVIDIGGLDINGSLKQWCKDNLVESYLSVDIEKNDSVDEVCDANNLIEKFGKESFDVVISTEMMEHVEDWRNIIHNMKQICRPDGFILITTRSKGFGYHCHPLDCWRYSINDMIKIFSDCEIWTLDIDREAPGVFVFVKKPTDFVENDLSGIELFRITQ